MEVVDEGGRAKSPCMYTCTHGPIQSTMEHIKQHGCERTLTNYVPLAWRTFIPL